MRCFLCTPQFSWLVEISTSSEPKLKRKSELGPYREKTFVMNGSPMVEPAKDTELSTTYPGQGTQPLEKVFHVNCEQPTRVVWVKHSLNRGKSRAVVWKIDDKKNLISLLSQSHCFTVSICMTAFLWWVVPITRLSVPVSIHCAYYWVWFQSRAGLSEKGPYPYPSLLLELATPWEPCPLFPCNEGRMA